MRLPALTIEAARYLLAPVGEWAVFALLEDGRLSHAWDLSLGPSRREIRILPASVARYLAQRQGRAAPPVTDAEALAALLPDGQRPELLPVGWIWRALNLSEAQPLALARAGELTFEIGTIIRRGNCIHRVTTESFCRFLARRRVS